MIKKNLPLLLCKKKKKVITLYYIKLALMVKWFVLHYKDGNVFPISNFFLKKPRLCLPANI